MKTYTTELNYDDFMSSKEAYEKIGVVYMPNGRYGELILCNNGDRDYFSLVRKNEDSERTGLWDLVYNHYFGDTEPTTSEDSETFDTKEYYIARIEKENKLLKELLKMRL